MTLASATLAAPDTTAIARLRDVDWLFFDIGYTLSDETGGWQDQFERLSRATQTTAKPVSVDEIWAMYHELCADFAPGQWRAICDRCATTPAEAQRYRALNRHWRHDLERPYAGVAELLAAMSSRYHLGVIANQFQGTRDRLDGWGLLPYFKVIVSSAEAGVTKPDPAIFQLALREANCEPHRAVMIGDRVDNDVAPANRLGMLSVHVRQGGSGAQRPRSADEVATLTIDDVVRLGEMLV